MRTLRLIASFYKSYVFTSISITMTCLYFPYTIGITSFFPLFWFKIMTLGMIFYLNNSYKRHEFYYYKNLGVSKKLLWISTLSFDFILYIALFIITLKIR